MILVIRILASALRSSFYNILFNVSASFTSCLKSAATINPLAKVRALQETGGTYQGLEIELTVSNGFCCEVEAW